MHWQEKKGIQRLYFDSSSLILFKRSYVKGVILLMMLFSIYFAVIIIVRLQKHYRWKSPIDHSKKRVYKLCQSFSQRNDPLRTSSSDHALIDVSDDVYLLLDYSPRRDEPNELYLQMATSYLLLENLQKLSREQQTRTHVIIVLREIANDAAYTRLAQWFRSIYTPYIATINIIRIDDNHQSSREWMISYMKSNGNIHSETILFFLADDYIVDTMMLSETIEFFSTHNPCFIAQIDYADRCRLVADDGFEHIVVPGRTRLWRSIPFNHLPFVCRLKTLLAFEHLIRNTTNVVRTNEKLRALVGGVEIFYCPIPSYSARIETLILPDEVNITESDNMATYYKDWWSMARHALAKAQKLDLFPYPKINERTLFA